MTEVLIAGANGMLGSAFYDHLAAKARPMHRDTLDVTRISAIERAIVASGARLVINCAADTNVDAAETTPDTAWQVNGLLPGILGDLCRRSGASLVHFSSTGAYGNWKDSPYDEDDPLHPTTVHHRSKVAGEKAIRESGCEALIIRTGWLFGGRPEHPKNFVWNRIKEAVSKPTMTSDAHQTGNPTATADVVRQTLATLAAGYRGTINVVSQGSATRYDYVRRIVSAAGLSTEVTPALEPFLRPAPVSSNEAAVNRRLRLLRLDTMPHWTTAVDHYVDTLKASDAFNMLRSYKCSKCN